MIVIRVSLTIKPDARAAFLQALTEIIPAGRAFAGCERYCFYEDVEQENAFLLYHEWTTAADAEAYGLSGHRQQVAETLAPLFATAPITVFYEAVAVPPPTQRTPAHAS